jgi:tRNA-specific adenosine deaminase 3
LVSADSVGAALKPHIQDRHDLPKLFSATVPIHPPTTTEQAEILSKKYWPCVFNPASQTIQQAPPLNLLRATHAELDTERLDTYMRLAEVLGKGSLESRVGRVVGAVIVDPVRNEVVAAAGDARWWTFDQTILKGNVQREGEGRPEYHALMRAVSMVAQKEVRRALAPTLPRLLENTHSRELNGRSLTPIELAYLSAPEQISSEEGVELPAKQSCVRPDPYLCNGLDVYLTHEPCACCSMAMIHSRFRACIFMKSMPGTGALCAETHDGCLGYGLFWRKQLNWRVMTFQFHQLGPELASVKSDSEIFHA